MPTFLKLRSPLFKFISRHKKLLGMIFLTLVIALIVIYRNAIWIRLEHFVFLHSRPAYTGNGSRVETFTFPAKSLSGVTKEVKVYLPQAYGEPGRSFPVLYLLHGDPGTNTDWLNNTNLQKKMDEVIDQALLPPTIVVMPDGNGPVIKEGQYVNATAIHQPMEDYILEVVQETDQRYATFKTPQLRAIGGLSSGGYAAFNLSFHHPDLFGAALSFSGFFTNKEWVIPKLFGKNLQAKAANDPYEQLLKGDVKVPGFMFFALGEEDYGLFTTQNQLMATALKQRHYPFIFERTQGIHGWLLWGQQIELALKRLGGYWYPYLELQ